MSSLHNALRFIGLQRGYRRALGEVQLERAGETLTPVYSPWLLPEHAALRDEWLMSGLGNAAAGGAGTYAHVQLYNPTTSNVLVVCEKIEALSPANACTIWSAGYSITRFATGSAGTPRNRDLRLVKGTILNWRGIAELRYDNAQVIVLHYEAWRGSSLTPSSAGAPFYLEMPVVIPPGWGFSVVPQAVTNIPCQVSFQYRERRMEPGEFATELD